MKVIEHFTRGKTGREELNEDRLVVTDDFIVLMDGVTSKACPKIEGRSGGRFAVDTVAAAIVRLNSAATAREAVDFLTGVLCSAVEEKIRLPEKSERPAFAMVAYSKAHRQVWRVADPYLMLDGKLYLNNKLTDQVISEARALMVEIALQNGVTEQDIAGNDIGRETVMPLLKGQHIFANQTGPYGFGVINGKFIPDELIEIFDARQTHEIVLSSDGYPQLFPTLKASEDYLAQLLKEDPLLFRKYKSTKGLQAGNVSYDDRTYVRFLTSD